MTTENRQRLSTRSVGRKALGALPSPVADRVRTVYRVLQGQRRPPEPTVRLPADVSNQAELIDYLSDTDVFGEAEAECIGYLNDAIQRFQITIGLVDQIIQEGRVLELGSNPYFITRLLLRRGLSVRCANWFGDDRGARDTQVVTGTRSGERHYFEFDHFNVEAEPFPYPDGAFDLVLCCEILEHLPHDPVHMLAEIHRVLRRDTGWLLLTTPNPVRLDNLSRMLAGENVYEELSGYGAYGRHNREYTTKELERLLLECGYTGVRVFAMDIHSHSLPDSVRWSGADLRGRGDNIFAVARASGEPRWPYPEWLYASRHALARRVRPDLRMGYNDALQSSGFHGLERDNCAAFRWTGMSPGRALVTSAHDGEVRLIIEGKAPPASVGSDITLVAEVPGKELSWKIACDEQPFTVSAKINISGGDHEVTLTTDRTWQPATVLGGGDFRELGIRITRVALEHDT